MRERIDMAVFAVAPGFVRLSLRLALDPAAALPEAARDYLLGMADLAAQSPQAPDPRMAAWREAYQELGLGPDALPPPEALMAWTRSPGGVPSQGALRDLVHGFMLCHRLPVAAYDLGAVQGDLWLRPSRGSEQFLGLGEQRPETPPINELILADSGEQVLARHWHGAQGAPTAAHAATRLALVHIDLLPPAAGDAARFGAAFQALAADFLGQAGELRLLSMEAAQVGW